MSIDKCLNIKPKHYRDGEKGPCFICGKTALYILVKGNSLVLCKVNGGNAAGLCMRNACLNMALLTDKLEWAVSSYKF
jgi:hypothetical protein